MLMKCWGLSGTPRVGEIYLPIPHPGYMCSGEDQQPAQIPAVRSQKYASRSASTIQMYNGKVPRSIKVYSSKAQMDVSR